MKYWLCYIMPGQPGFFDPRMPGGGPPATGPSTGPATGPTGGQGGQGGPSTEPPKPKPATGAGADDKATKREDVIPEPELPKNLKPDSPGGQTATVNGKTFYVPGSTMYNLGFRTPAEYRMAQQKGTTLGPHAGIEIPPGTMLFKTGVFNDDAGRQTREYVRIQVDEQKLADPEFQSFMKNAMYTGNEKEWREKQADLNRRKYEMDTKLTNNQITRNEYDAWLDKEIETYNSWLDTKISSGASRDILIDYGDYLITQGQYDRLMSLEGRDRFEYGQRIGVYGESDVYVERGGEGYIVPETEALDWEKAAREISNAERVEREYNKATPEGKFEILKREGIIPKNAEFVGVDDKGDVRYKLPTTEAGPGSGSGPQKFRDMVDAGLIPKGSKYIGVDLDGNVEYYTPEQIQEQADYQAAQDKLAGAKNKDGTYDMTKLAIYAQKNPDYKEVMSKAGFDDEAIKGVEQRKALGVRPDEYIKDYFDTKGWELPSYLGGKVNINTLPGSKQGEWMAKFDKHLLEARAAYKADGGNEKAILISGAVKLGEWILPGVSTAYNWKRMTPAERFKSLAWDVASVAALVTIHKGLGKLGKVASGVSKAESLAAKAGETSVRYNRVMTDLVKSMSKTDTKPAYTNYLSGKAQQLRAASIDADRAFLKKLGTIKEISAKDLKTIETKSGIKGLTKTVQAADKARGELKAAWAELEKIRGDSALYPNQAGYITRIQGGKVRVLRNAVGPDIKYRGLSTKPTDLPPNRYYQLLERLEKAQAKYNEAIGKSGEVLRPRIQPGISPEFKGFSTKWKNAAGLTEKESKILQDMNEWLGLTKWEAEKPGGPGPGRGKWSPKQLELEPGPKQTKTLTKTATEVAEKQGSKLELKPEYGEPKVEPSGETPATPSVKGGASIKGSIGVSGKTDKTTKTGEYPDTLRMTPEQAARLNGDVEQAGADVTAGYRTMDEALQWLKAKGKTGEYGKPTGATWEAVGTQLKGLTQVTNTTGPGSKAGEGVKTGTGVSTGPEVKGMPGPGLKPATGTKTKAVTKTTTSTVVTDETITKPPPDEPGKGKFWYRGLRFPGQNASDDTKRNFLKKTQGFTARRRGALHGKDMWLINFYPYGEKDRTVLWGGLPEGAKRVTGKGSLEKTLYVKGTQPKAPIYDNTGAVDDVIIPKGKGVTVVSVPENSKEFKEKKNRAMKVPKPKPIKANTIDLGGGVEMDKRGRGHIKIM